MRFVVAVIGISVMSGRSASLSRSSLVPHTSSTLRRSPFAVWFNGSQFSFRYIARRTRENLDGRM